MLEDDCLTESPNLNLTSCLIAWIYQGKIDDWTHSDITKINPSMEFPVELDYYGEPKEDQNLPIKVANRALRSSATFAFTSYLHKTCPDHWGADLVGSSISWPMEGNDQLYTVQGTPAMIEAITGELGFIGYMDAGSAID